MRRLHSGVRGQGAVAVAAHAARSAGDAGDRSRTNGVSLWQAAAQDVVWGAAIGAHSGPSLKPEAEAWTHTNPLVGASPQASGGFGSGPLEAWAVTASGSAPHTTLPQAANGLIDGPGDVEFGRRVTSAAALSPSKAKAVGAPRPPPPPPRAVSVPGVPGGATASGAVGQSKCSPFFAAGGGPGCP